MTHLGRPKGRHISAYSLKPVAKRLSSLLGFRIQVARSIIGKEVEKTIEKMENGDVLLLENLRFDIRETQSDSLFAETLAQLGDLYVNDAFAVSHRANASLEAITKHLPSYAGPLLVQEVTVLRRLEKQAKKPFVLVLGGLKMTTKLPIIERFISELDTLLVGGALANVFLAAQSVEIGRSVFEEEAVESARKLLRLYSDKILLPVDVIVASSLRKDAKNREVSVEDIGKSDRIVDIGSQTQKNFQAVLENAKTIVWNGPLGYCEIYTFCAGTRAVARVIANQTGKATTIVGGGDTLPVIETLKLADKFTLLSTGGGALLQFLSGESLPGIEALTM